MNYSYKSNIFTDYLKDISRYPLLSREDEYKLAKQVEKGDIKAKEKLVNSNLRLVISAAKKYCRQADIMDLIEEGNITLIRAAEKFKPDFGNKFSSYAMWWIKQGILRYLADKYPIHIPTYKVAVVNKIKRTIREFKGPNKREPSYKEISDIIGMSPEDIEKAVEEFRRETNLLSLDRAMEINSDNRTLYDRHGEERISTVMESEKRRAVYQVLDKLAEREKEVIEYRFGLKDGVPKTLESIGHIYGVSRERIRQIEAKALKRLRDLKSPKLAEFLYEE